MARARLRTLGAVVLGAVLAGLLAACSSSAPPAEVQTVTPAPTGFAPGALIGVAMPSKTSENWVLAGALFRIGLTEAGFSTEVTYASPTGTVADQQGQITQMIAAGAKVIIIGAADGSQLTTELAAAHRAGVSVIAFDRLITGTADVDYYVAFDNYTAGRLQGEALLEGLAARAGAAPYDVELFAGSPDDANSKVFFDGAMSVLQPEIDRGRLDVVSGQVTLQQVVTDGWKPENAQRRLGTLLTANYAEKTLDGVLAPNDTLARAVIATMRAAHRPVPVVTGQDSDAESVRSIMAGVQYSTINKDTRLLVKQAVQMVRDLAAGTTPVVNDTTSYDNGAKVVPAYLLTPMLVTRQNAAEAYANDPTLAPLTRRR